MTDTPGDGATLYESKVQTREPSISSGVDVARAEAEFNELARQLSNTSAKAANDRSSSHGSTVNNSDLEKSNEKDEERFDLREYLRSSNDANQAAGIKHKHVGVTWDDLEVKVLGGFGSKMYIGTFGASILYFFLGPVFWLMGLYNQLAKKEIVTRTILHKQSGVLKPGEMCLVLGCPGSGCTTFLKSVTNQRQGLFVSGDVRYAGMSAEEMEKYYQGEVVFNEEDDIHIATLTVAQTLAFALATKTPGPAGRLPGISRKEFDREVQSLLLRMLNITHTDQTLVGDEFVRGVSGGERKRVSIAEMLTTRANLQAWDNSTRGLDASTALDFVKSLRVLTDILGQTTFVTLYQAGEGIYELFDKVMVINDGRQVFYGPPKEARQYFEDLGYKALPRQSTPDYLTGCTDPNERQFAPGRSTADVPASAEALEMAFRTSSHARELEVSREKSKTAMVSEKTDQEAFRAAVAADKKRGVSKKSPYTLGITGQVRALTIRQFQMRMQDKFQLYTSFGLSTLLAIVIGAAFINLPLTSAGAFTRGGVIFSAVLTVCLDAFGEMPGMMLGRPILRKQTNYRMYRPAAVALANLFSDLPFSFVRVLLFDIIVYFMAGLNRSAGGFFTFHLFVYVAYLAMQGFFRTFGLLCTSFDSAFRLAVFFIPNMVQYSGYTIPVNSMKRWLFWIYYINPISYAWQGCMINEFMRISLTCDGNSVVPRNGPGLDKYPTELSDTQVCTLFGAKSGSSLIDGSDYIRAGYGIESADLWRNFGIIVAFLVAFIVTQLVALEYFPQYGFAGSLNFYAKETAETKKLNETLQAKLDEKAALREKGEGKKDDLEHKENKEVIDFSHKKSFTWENLNYTVPVPGGTRRLLHDVNGYVKPGTLTALMGASGAGKSTTLDVLAQRKTIGVITGDVLVDGRPLSSDFARGTAYAEQMDVHDGTATVREAMRFSAYLRQPAEISEAEKDAYVEEMIELLELQPLTEALVWSLNVEARKRLTIGVELAAKPDLLLFLDEPTSGLDSQSAFNLVRFLRKLADQGQAILCTIHQPSSILFEAFDRVLLLESGGETVYFGDIGKDSHVIREYFAKNGAHCPPNVNPAEYMLEAIGAGLAPRVGNRDWKDIWLDSPEHQKTLVEIKALKDAGLAKPAEVRHDSDTYATSFLYQLTVVVKRQSIGLWRSPDYIFTRLFVAAFISLIISLSFLQLGNSLRDLQFRVFAIFWVVILPVLVMSQIEPMFIFSRRVFIREASSRIYSPQVFAIGQLIGELPYNILVGIVYWVLMVYPIGFGQGAAGTAGTGFQLLVTLFMIIMGVTLGQLIAALSPSVQVAVLFNPFVGLVLNTFCGVVIPYPTMESGWRWLYQLNPYTRTLSAMVSTELHGLAITCRSDEFSVFNPPSGQTCAQWGEDFVNVFGGYIDNLTDNAACRYCQFRVGDEFFVPLGMSYGTRWRDAFLLLAFIAFNIIATIVASRFLRYAKR